LLAGGGVRQDEAQQVAIRGRRFMQVTETSADGLKREFRIVVPNDEVESQIASRLDELGRTIRLPGFRPGKVPTQLLRRRFGQSVRGEVLENTVQDSTAEAIRERNLRPALPPKVDIVSAAEGTDFEYRMSVELLPDIPQPSFADLGIERLVVDIPDEDTDRAIERIGEAHRKSETVERPAESGDILVIDVEGRVEDREIPGASGKDRQIVLGSGNFIPGFEEQLVGAAAGEHRTVRVTFPDNYGATELAGKDAVFAVDVKEVRQRAPLVVDDELGKAVGLESLAELRQEVQQRLQRDYAAAARLRMKRALLDKLAERYDFPLPPGMVDLEFEAIWAEHQATAADPATIAGPPSGTAAADSTGGTDSTDGPDSTASTDAATGSAAVAIGDTAAETSNMVGETDDTVARSGDTVAEADATVATVAELGGTDATIGDEAARSEYRRLAERRVRLGLLLAEVGRGNNITVTQDELNQAVVREARRFPGRERQVLDLYRQHPEAAARLRAPIFEDKVIDFIFELAKPDERRVTPQELMAVAEPSGPESGNAASIAEPT
jgi:trigger factor